MQEDLQALVSTLQTTVDEVYRLDPLWKQRGEWPAADKGGILHAPASEADLARWEKRLGFPLPPSYRAFLLLHDGWEHFWLDFTLAGVKGPHTEKVRTKVHEYEQWQMGELGAEVDPRVPDSAEAWEGTMERNLYLPRHLAFGTTFGGELLVFDLRTRRPDGELDIVYWTLDFGAWPDRRFPDFTALLRWAIGEAEQALRRPARKKPAAKKIKK